MTKVILESGGIPAEDAVRRARSGQRTDKQTEIVALLEQAGAKPAAEFKIDPAQLARYAGTYRNPAGNELTFAVADGKLTGGPAGMSLTLAATDEKTFRVVGASGRDGDIRDSTVENRTARSPACDNQGGTTTNYARVEGK